MITKTGLASIRGWRRTIAYGRLVASILVVLAAVLITTVAPDAQTGPRTPWGDPDLQGMWPSGALIDVPFERAPELGTRAVLTDAEFAARVKDSEQQAEADAAEFVAPGSTGVNAPSHWRERGVASKQASLIVDPPDGRLPPMTEDGARRAKAWPSGNPAGGFAGPSSFNAYDRCISRGVLGSAFPNIYSSGMEIMQAPGLVVLRYEMIHETRIVPLDGRPRPTTAVRSYMGEPRGHWEGQTLVVETTNFNGRTGSLARNGNGNPTSPALRLIERFTRRDARTLDYRVTIDDPQTWTRSWSVGFPLVQEPDYVMYEYACHEGNYALPNMLRASRAAERQ